MDYIWKNDPDQEYVCMHGTPWYAHIDWTIDNFKYMLDNFKPAETQDPKNDNNDNDGKGPKIVKGTLINSGIDSLGEKNIVSTHFF